VLLADKHACYMRLYPGTQADEAARPAPVSPLMVDVPPALLERHGLTVDHAALAEVDQALERLSIPRAEAKLWIDRALGRLEAGLRPPSKQECEATLSERFGAEGAATIKADANVAFDHLSPATRTAVLATWLGTNAAFIEWLAGHGRRLRGAGRAV
jgi:hypothetical protein